MDFATGTSIRAATTYTNETTTCYSKTNEKTRNRINEKLTSLTTNHADAIAKSELVTIHVDATTCYVTESADSVSASVTDL